jgi:hypothetical protein
MSRIEIAEQGNKFQFHQSHGVIQKKTHGKFNHLAVEECKNLLHAEGATVKKNSSTTLATELAGRH